MTYQVITGRRRLEVRGLRQDGDKNLGGISAKVNFKALRLDEMIRK